MNVKELSSHKNQIKSDSKTVRFLNIRKRQIKKYSFISSLWVSSYVCTHRNCVCTHKLRKVKHVCATVHVWKLEHWNQFSPLCGCQEIKLRESNLHSNQLYPWGSKCSFKIKSSSAVIGKCQVWQAAVAVACKDDGKVRRPMCSKCRMTALTSWIGLQLKEVGKLIHGWLGKVAHDS